MELQVFPIGGSIKLGFFGPQNHLICGEDTLSIWSLDGPTELMEFSSHYHPMDWALSPDKNTLALQCGGKVDLIVADE